MSRGVKMNEEVLRVLKMVEDGKIGSEKAAELIEALNRADEKPKSISGSNDDKMLKVRVLSTKNDNVNINLPIKFIRAILKTTGEIPINIDGNTKSQIDTKALLEAIDSGYLGKFVDVKTGEGDIVEVFIE
jgi:hypothetical protein